MRTLLPPFALLGVACVTYFSLNRVAVRRAMRLLAEMPTATPDERTAVAVSRGGTGELLLGFLAVGTLAGTGVLWLLVVLIGRV